MRHKGMDDREFQELLNRLRAALVDVEEKSLSETRHADFLLLCRDFLRKYHQLTSLSARSPKGRLINIFYCKCPPCPSN